MKNLHHAPRTKMGSAAMKAVATLGVAVLLTGPAPAGSFALYAKL